MHAQTISKDVLRQRQQYYEAISHRNLMPLWEVLGALVPKAPATPVLPAFWRYAEIREQVLEAGRLITAPKPSAGY